MIVEKLLPEVYYKESRDFAYIGRLIELAFNYMKTAADAVNVHIDDDSINDTIVELLVNTLGFESKHEYITKDLVYIASVFSDLLKHKGSIYAIDKAVRVLLNSQGIKKAANYEFVEKKGCDLNIKIPAELRDLILLEDLFEYILPAGVTYKFTRVEIIDTDLNTESTTSSSIRHMHKSDVTLSTITSKLPEAAQIPDGIGSIYTGIVPNNIDAIDETEVIVKKATSKKATTKKTLSNNDAKLDEAKNKTNKGDK